MTHQHQHLTLKQAALNGLVVFVLSVIEASYKWSVPDFYIFEILMFISIWTILILPRFVFEFFTRAKKIFVALAMLVVLIVLLLFICKPFAFSFPSQISSNTILLLSIFIFSECAVQLLMLNNAPLMQGKQGRTFNVIGTGFQILCVGLSVQFGINLIITAFIFVAIIKLGWLLNVLKKEDKSWNTLSTFNLRNEKTWIIHPTLLALCIDGLLVALLFPASSFLAFRFGSREILLAALFASTLHQSIVLNANGSLRFAELKSEASRLVRLIFPLTIVLMLLSHFLFSALYSFPNIESASFFNTYLILVLIRVPFPQTIIENQKINFNLNRVHYTELGLNVVLSLTFAKWFGPIGIAYATVSVALLSKIYQIVYCARKIGIPPQKYIPIKIYIISSILLISVYIFTEHYIY